MKSFKIIPLLLVLVIMALGVTPTQDEPITEQETIEQTVEQDLNTFQTVDLDLERPDYTETSNQSILTNAMSDAISTTFTTPVEHPFMTDNQSLYLAYNRLKIISNLDYGLYNVSYT